MSRRIYAATGVARGRDAALSPDPVVRRRVSRLPVRVGSASCFVCPVTFPLISFFRVCSFYVALAGKLVD